MEIKLKELCFEFSKEEIIEFLNKNGYKIEEHPLPPFLDEKFVVNELFAVPFDKEYDKDRDRSIDITFRNLIHSKIRNYLLNDIIGIS